MIYRLPNVVICCQVYVNVANAKSDFGFETGVRVIISRWSYAVLYVVGNWAKALPERFGIVNYVVTYSVNRQGDVYIALNGENLPGPFFGGVNVSSKLWALIDIYGNATGVEFLGT